MLPALSFNGNRLPIWGGNIYSRFGMADICRARDIRVVAEFAEVSEWSGEEQLVPKTIFHLSHLSPSRQRLPADFLPKLTPRN